MIRRRQGDEFWLVTQQDHARVAGVIARAVGNRHFARPAAADRVYAAVDAHDDGWAASDAVPTPDADGRPADVFDAPRAVSHAAWLASARLAGEADAYVGLLVGLHQLSLSARSAAATQSDKIDDEHRRRLFDLNKIQHALIEQIENYRAAIGLPLDKPLRLGLSEGWGGPAEDRIKFDLRLLQAADVLSLYACCADGLPAGLVAQPHPRPGAGQVTLRATPHSFGVGVRPWPFAENSVRVEVPYRAVPAAAFNGVEAYRRALDDATRHSFTAELRPD